MSVAAAEPRTTPERALARNQTGRKRRLAVRARRGRRSRPRASSRPPPARCRRSAAPTSSSAAYPAGKPSLDELSGRRAAAAPRRRSAGRRSPGRKPRPSRIPSSCGPNESVTPASNQQIIPALTPVRTRALLPRLAQQRVEAVHAPDREHVRGVAAADDDHVLRRGRASRRSAGGQGKKSTRRTSARSAERVVDEERVPGFSALAVPTQRTRGRRTDQVEDAVPQRDASPPPTATIRRSAIGQD